MILKKVDQEDCHKADGGVLYRYWYKQNYKLDREDGRSPLSRRGSALDCSAVEDGEGEQEEEE